MGVLGIGALLAWHAQTNGFVYSFDPRVFPVRAADWLEEHPMRGEMFNDFNWGGYLLFRLWPNQRVFVDSQSDFYGESLVREYESILESRPGWQTALRTHDVAWVIIPPSSPLARALAADPGWRNIYADSTAVIYTSSLKP
jgi:hypothetical protein